MSNQNPEQKARDAIDAQLRASGWAVQDRKAINFHAGQGQAVREYTTDCGPADYVLFVDGQPIGVIEAKKETLGQSITSIYATQRLSSSHVPADAQVCISTIQRMYSILQGREMTEGEDEHSPAESSTPRPKKLPEPVRYNEKVPPEFFDVMGKTIETPPESNSATQVNLDDSDEEEAE